MVADLTNLYIKSIFRLKPQVVDFIFASVLFSWANPSSQHRKLNYTAT